MEWLYEPEICQPVQSVSVSQISDGEIYHNDAVSMVTPDKKTLLGAKAPAAWASPHCDSAVLPVPGAGLNAGKSECIARAPAPLGGQGWRKGGCKQKDGPEPTSPGFSPPNFSRHFLFSSGKIRPHKLSPGTFLDFPTFKPEKIRPEKFQSKIFWDFQLSTGNFFGFSNFAAKKSPCFLIPVPVPYRRIYDGEVS
ncbi:hypothetical protein [Methanoregula sp. UBA64]|uniref:hypothetical protein n=1 Tax=Methanoregula sp. UBA64 TaxID=1915554 RepID=UPI0025FF0064|nr:hypothetical protein [Methanoregula sp. UBA64]